MGSRATHQGSSRAQPRSVLCGESGVDSEFFKASAVLIVLAQVNFAGRPFYQIGILGFKVALCWAYLRILKASQKPGYRALVWTVMIACIIGHVAGALALIFQCSPVRKSWYPLTPGTCLPNDATFYGLAAISIFFDVFIFFLPIPLLLSLNIDAKKKVVLCGVFLLGLLTTVCSIMRMYQITAIAKTGNSTMLVLWGVIELNIGVCCSFLSKMIIADSFRIDIAHLHSNPRSSLPILSRLHRWSSFQECLSALLHPHPP